MSAYEDLDEQKKFACRVIADHARATAFSIADGILPGNEGRNYVLRKIMRRAIYHLHYVLNVPLDDDPEQSLFFKVTNKVVDLMHNAYPELEAARGLIERIVKLEQSRFVSTQAKGLSELEAYLSSEKRNEILFGITSESPLDYPKLARFYDTFGLQPDLIRVRLEEGGYSVDEDEFNQSFYEAMQQLQQTGAKGMVEGKSKTKPAYAAIAGRINSLFRGYETTRIDDAKVLSLISGENEVAELSEGQEGEVVLDQTPFYAESGGQVGDVGRIVDVARESGTGVPPVDHAQDARATSIATVVDTYSPAQGLIVHKVKVEKGTLKVGDTVTAEVDVEKRDATRRNHTATHLVHAALREVLGGHVKQAGSVVAPNYLRFDFTHYQPLTEAEIKEVERLVNEQVLRNVKVETDIMPVEEAIRSGAMALFGEKYSGMMRVLTVPGFSKELCGGTHVRATGDIGVFKITSDESIASGVRRIRAVTGIEAYERFREDEEIIEEVTSNLRT